MPLFRQISKYYSKPPIHENYGKSLCFKNCVDMLAFTAFMQGLRLGK